MTISTEQIYHPITTTADKDDALANWRQIFENAAKEHLEVILSEADSFINNNQEGFDVDKLLIKIWNSANLKVHELIGCKVLNKAELEELKEKGFVHFLKLYRMATVLRLPIVEQPEQNNEPNNLKP
jgi:hypothetical protein